MNHAAIERLAAKPLIECPRATVRTLHFDSAKIEKTEDQSSRTIPKYFPPLFKRGLQVWPIGPKELVGLPLIH